MATIGLPIASASKPVSGVPSQSDGNTLRSNADRVAGDVAAEPDEDEPVAESEARGLRLQVREQRPLPDQEETGLGALAGRPRAAASTRYEFPFDSWSRVIVPMANSPAARPSRRARGGDLGRVARRG